MTARGEQGQEGRLDRLGLQVQRGQVAVQVVHRHERQAAGKRDRLGGREADEQGADQPRPLGHGDGIEIRERHARLGERLLDHRHD